MADDRVNGTELSESEGESLSKPYRCVYDLLNEADKHNASTTAIACLHQKGDRYATVSGSRNSPYLKWTFAELSRASHAFAGALSKAGVRPGMRIVAFLSNRIEFHISFRAALALNCPFAPLNPRSIGSAEQVRNIYDVVKPSVMVAEDLDVVSQLEKLDPESVAKLHLRLVADCSDDDDNRMRNWQSLDTFLKPLDAEKESMSLDVSRHEEDVVLLLMTSGTTSLPKGCPHTNRSYATILQAKSYLTCFDNTRVICGHIPPSHIFGINTINTAFLNGARVVHPSSYFDAGSALKAIQKERCTDIYGVPAIMTALLTHPDFPEIDTSCLKFVILGATTVTVDHIKTVIQDLGASKATDAYGMTEAAPATGVRYDDLQCEVPDRVTSGPALPGMRLRVCDPGTGKLMPREQTGELHMGGDAVISEYWRASPKQQDDTFYDDDKGKWFKTGDQAVMLADGHIKIVGRYKDLIIRGGENISPRTIEDSLSRTFGLAAEVCGIPDDIAGEVPVAVIKRGQGQEIRESELKESLVKELGPAFAVEAVVDIEAIGMEEFPRTANGKVQKTIIREKASEFLSKQLDAEQAPASHDERSIEELTEILIKVWTRLLRVSEGTIGPETQIDEWADSLTMGRFPTLLQRESGKNISLQDLVGNRTPASQANFLGSTSDSSQPDDLPRIPTHEGPPTQQDMVHTRGDRVRTKRTVEMCENALSPLGLDWQAVQDVLPLYSFQQYFLRKRRLQSNNHRHAWVCAGTSVKTARTAIEAALSHHDIFRTMAVMFDDETPLHIVVRPGEKWYANCITVLEKPVNTAADLRSVVFDDPNLDYAAIPGPLFRVVLVHIADEDCAGLVYMAQHSVFDGISITSFLEDLDLLLESPERQKLSNVLQFKAYADSAYSLRFSEAARASVNWQVNRLIGLKAKEAALFPTQKAPEWFKGNCEGWIDPSTGRPGVRKLLKGSDGSLCGAQGLSKTCNLSGSQRLKKQHAIEAPCVLKAALAILNSRKTGQSVALFAQYQAARTWPFLAKWQNALMPSAMAVDGPTVETVVLAVDLEPQTTTVLQLMQGLQEEQNSLNEFQHAPFGDVVTALNDRSGNGDGDIMVEVWRRQIFNWLPNAPDSGLKRLRKVQQLSRTDVGILWNCMQSEHETVTVMPSWDDAQLTLDEAEGLLHELISIAGTIVAEQNWNLQLRKILRPDDQ